MATRNILGYYDKYITLFHQGRTLHLEYGKNTKRFAHFNEPSEEEKRALLDPPTDYWPGFSSWPSYYHFATKHGPNDDTTDGLALAWTGISFFWYYEGDLEEGRLALRSRKQGPPERTWTIYIAKLIYEGEDGLLWVSHRVIGQLMGGITIGGISSIRGTSCSTT